jgi:hypothetical protein
MCEEVVLCRHWQEFGIQGKTLLDLNLYHFKGLYLGI